MEKFMGRVVLSPTMGRLNEVVGNVLTPVTLSLAAIIIITLVSQRKIQGSFKGAPVWPFVGVFPSLMLNLGRLYDWYNDILAVNGGTLKFPGLFWKTTILTADPANIEYMVKTAYHNFGKGDYFKEMFGDLFGDSILVQDGEPFKQMNKSICMAFALPAFRNNAITTLSTSVNQKLIPLLSHAAANNIPLDLQDVFRRLSFDNTCLVGFGIDPASLALDLSTVPFLDAFDEAVGTLLLRVIVPRFCWKMMKFLRIGSEARLLSSRAIVYKFVDDLLARLSAAGYDLYDSPCLGAFWTYIQLERESGRVYSLDMIRSSMVSLIMAGKDTLSAGLTYFFWLVAQHPEVEAKILAELQGVLNKRSTNKEEWSFGFEEVKQMEYLHAALSESLRLYPPIVAEGTQAAEDDVLPDGTPTEKGAQVYYSIYSCGRLESVWGEDCLQFRPERWLQNERFVRKSDFKFAVFNAGPRRCAGREFAYWHMKWAAASILIRYRIKMVDKHPVVPKFTIVLSMKHGLLVTVHPRDRDRV
ncbi:hypothetical protein SUGI_1169730 [Cryptomeria japonica]|uniref:cytochrome P450 86B1 n=1 Tax=Cryptomeria japonica TaxID=3369 RepID=UPI002414CA1C|nr:cytochrome P450 86B1 [Cryptomeria japonica]GLJ54464.1 hypothetical protein SUGI_1169730 [Cryptomeria japonica]